MSLSQGHVWVCVCVCDVAASSVCWGDASKSQWKWPDGESELKHSSSRDCSAF